MSNYRRYRESGNIFFCTIVTFRRRPLFEDQFCRIALRDSIRLVMNKYPFKIEAWVLLPEHLHCIWKLTDKEVSLRWRLIKSSFTRKVKSLFHKEEWMNNSRIKRKESTIWQRRFWEHQIKDQKDYNIHYNPVKHKLVQNVADWEFSTFHRFVEKGIYPPDWGLVDSRVVGFGE